MSLFNSIKNYFSKDKWELKEMTDPSTKWSRWHVYKNNSLIWRSSNEEYARRVLELRPKEITNEMLLMGFPCDGKWKKRKTKLS